jgi:endonuclease/exonuclease/phosphatase family metal-dependent hydrolase
LFDDVDNDTEYPEYDPGQGSWNTSLFHTKCMHIAEVIKSSVQNGPDIVGLQEIENENALKVLNEEYLKGLRYRYTSLVPAEESATNVAILSRIPITAVKTHQLQVNGPQRLRHIQEVDIQIDEHPVILFNNHWKSKLGGAEATELSRIEAAGIIKRRIAEIASENPSADVIVIGDFNENVDEFSHTGSLYQTALLPTDIELPADFSRKSIFYTFNPEDASVNGDTVILFSCWAHSTESGSYFFRGRWETIDNILLSPGLFDDQGISFESFEVVKRAFMVNEKGTPYRWESRRKEGYSDHLPLAATFHVNPRSLD